MMKITTFAMALGLCAVGAMAQPGPGHQGGGRPPVLPIMTALDTSKDGVLDASEIAGASAAIAKAFTADTNGKISVALLVPTHPGGTNTASIQQHKHPAPPMVKVLDANSDGYLDATEIANASTALLTLDKNSDGKLTRDELRPARPEGADAQRGPGGQDGGAMPPTDDSGPDGGSDMQGPPPEQ